MDVKQRYIKGMTYDVEEDFIEMMMEVDIRTGMKIGKFITDTVPEIPSNNLVSTIVEGLIIDDNNNPVTFAVEVIKTTDPNITLSDIQLIEMDEYLDLLNLNLNIKSNGFKKSRCNKKNS
jgi:hypothetical protein|tara:strand:+ start:7073 stop:7432 length:360 start_codon:yes stop_codon:yes gene_type:complete